MFVAPKSLNKSVVLPNKQTSSDRPFTADGISLNMLPVTTKGQAGPLIVMLHWLGGSAGTWTEVSEECASQGLVCIALDLPGFGHASALDPSEALSFTVATSVDTVIETIQSLRSGSREPWLLAGHSMGGKFASIIARAALNGTPGLEDLCGLVLFSPSPPGPEPMDESVREKNIGSLGQSTLDEQDDRTRAEDFVDTNTGKLPLVDAVRTRTVDDLLRMNRSAFVDWFTIGSREDWADRVGILPLPALVFAGTIETALGPDAQREHTLPHLPGATLTSLQGAGHLSPLERPSELANRIVAFAKEIGISLHRPDTELASSTRALIDSSLTSPQTRAVMNQRLAEDSLPEPPILTPDELLTLRAAGARIIPGCPFDLAARTHRWLALPAHDGWRHASLPPDTEAWKKGLRSIDGSSLREYGVGFSALDASRQDEILSRARDGKLGRGLLSGLHLGEGSGHFTAAEMSDWFGDLHAELTRIYMADPRTMHRIGFTGFADDGGFTQIRLNGKEIFEREVSEQ
jgi:pimeloyl-ACP methyl ester carboxylesterase